MHERVSFASRRRLNLRSVQKTPITENVDSIVIGVGQAGPSLAVRCANAGMKAVLIERERRKSRGAPPNGA